MIEHSNRIINNLEKLERNRKQIPKSFDKQLRDKAEEVINTSIQELIPSDRVVEWNFISNHIAETTGHTRERVEKALLQSDTKTLIFTEVDNVVFLKRNTI